MTTTRGSASLGLLPAAGLVLALGVPCGASAQGTPPGKPHLEVESAPPAATPAMGLEARYQELARRLDAAIAGKRTLDDVRVETSFAGTKTAPRAVVLYGSGVAIWKLDTQLTVPHKVVIDVLTALQRSGFATARSKDDIHFRASGSGEPRGPQRTQVIALAIGDIGKDLDVVVGEEGEEAEREGKAVGEREKEEKEREEEGAKSFANLANRILDLVEKSGKDPVKAADLADGLAKLESGKLAPETLSVAVLCPRGEPGSKEGWVVSFEGLDGYVQTRTPGVPPKAPTEVALSRDNVKGLVKLLLETKVASLPINVHEDGYTDIRVSVLNQRKVIQARPFAGPPPADEATARAAVDRIRSAAHELGERLLAAHTAVSK